MYLLDTNLILEVLLQQTRAEETKQFLQSVEPEGLHLTEFSLYSLGVILVRRQMHDVFLQMVDDLLLSGRMRQARLTAEEMSLVVEAGRRFNLDFDDAYQYVAAEKYNLTIVSLDADFDRTERGRKTPAQVLAG